MGEVFKSPIPCDPSSIPTDLSVTDYAFQKLSTVLPLVAEKPWLHDVTSGKQVLFGNVERLAKNAASALTKKGFQPGDCLFFVTYDIVDIGVLQLAVWMLGGATRGCFQQEPPEEFARQMKEVKCKFVAVDSKTAALIKKAIAICDFDCEMIDVGDTPINGAIAFSDLTNDDGSGFPDKVDIDPKETILLIANTSGSTGVPKGVVHSHLAYISVMACFEGKIKQDINESLLLTASNFAVSSSWTICSRLSTGTTLYCMSRYDRSEFIGHVLKYKPTSIFLYPYIASWFARCHELLEHDFSFITRVMLGGSVFDPTSAELLEKNLPGAFLNLAYASSECLGVSVTFNSENKSFPLYSKTPDGEVVVSSGFLFPMVQAKIVNVENGNILGRNQLGRLYVKTPFLMKGYLVEVGKELDRSSIDEDGWFDTEDIALVDDNGQLIVRERVSFVFKYYMHQINPSEIEAVLHEHPSVQMACVIGVPNEETTTLAKALVVLKKGEEVTSDELIRLVAGKLQSYKHLHGGLQFVDQLPENKGRKLDRVTVNKLYGGVK